MKQSKKQRVRQRVAVNRTRKQHADAMATRYYLTLVKHDCRCSACGRKLRRRIDQMVFRKIGPVTLCVACADSDPLIAYRLSFNVERKLRTSRHAGTAEQDA